MAKSKSKLGDISGFIYNSTLPKEVVKLVVAKIGGRHYEGYYVLPDMEGSQPFRTQYDIAVDGSIYALNAGKGLGSITFTLLEGPFRCTQNANPAYLLTNLMRTNKLEDRRVEIIINYNAGVAKNVIKFVGYINNVTPQITETQNDSIIYYTTVDAEGTWQNV